MAVDTTSMVGPLPAVNNGYVDSIPAYLAPCTECAAMIKTDNYGYGAEVSMHEAVCQASDE